MAGDPWAVDVIRVGTAGPETQKPSARAGFGRSKRDGTAPVYPAVGEVSGRRAREVIPEAIRAESA
jgi:hypothetical protein